MLVHACGPPVVWWLLASVQTCFCRPLGSYGGYGSGGYGSSMYGSGYGGGYGSSMYGGSGMYGGGGMYGRPMGMPGGALLSGASM